MKKVLVLALAVALAFAAVIVPANAVYDENVERIAKRTLSDMAFGGVIHAVYVDLYEHYESAEEGKYEAIDTGSWCLDYIVPADDFEAEFNKRIVVTDEMLADARKTFKYDAENQTYYLWYPGGMGGTTSYGYVGYVDNGDATYDFYYGDIIYEYLSSVIAEEDIPEGMNKWDYIETLYDPTIHKYVYKGNEYNSGPEGGVFRKVGFNDYGLKYTIEINDGVVRVLSYGEYTAEDLPEKFETKPNYDINGDGEFNVFDYVSVKSLCMKDEPTEDEIASADVNGDGKLNIFDYVATKSAYFAQ